MNVENKGNGIIKVQTHINVIVRNEGNLKNKKVFEVLASFDGKLLMSTAQI